MQQGNRIILILGIIAVISGAAVWLEASSFQEKARLTEGKVVHVLGSSYRIRYFTDDGTEKIKQGSGRQHGFREGEPAKVWYLPDNPGKARLTDGKRSGERIIIIGGVCILLGIYPMFSSLKKNG